MKYFKLPCETAFSAISNAIATRVCDVSSQPRVRAGKSNQALSATINSGHRSMVMLAISFYQKAASLSLNSAAMLFSLVLVLSFVASCFANTQTPNSQRLWPKTDFKKIGQQAKDDTEYHQKVMAHALKKMDLESVTAFAEYHRQLWEGTTCNVTNFGGDTLDTLLGVAINALACPEHLEAGIVAQQWKLLFSQELPAIPGDSRSDADQFMHYVTLRRIGIIESLPSRSALEERLVLIHKDLILDKVPDEHDLTPSEELIMWRAQQIHQAFNQRIDADTRRREYSDSICMFRDFGSVPLNVVYGAGLYAIKCTDRFPKILELAQQWREFWELIEGTSPYDTRNDADRLLAYAFDRGSGLVQTTDEIKHFEKILADRFYKIVNA